MTRKSNRTDISRRNLAKGFGLITTLGPSAILSACNNGTTTPNPPIITNPPEPVGPTSKSLLDDIGDLLAPDENGVMLPQGFTSRIIARTGEAPVSSSSYLWHWAPDGGAVFENENDGWIYVSNNERSNSNGGVGALVFDADGNVIDAYSILEGTSRNCAGGATPWGTWMSCEEASNGLVWECDPFGNEAAISRPLMGAFAHEAVAVDETTNIIYMTEDKSDGRFYRFVPDTPNVGGRPDLETGTLEVAIIDEDETSVSWAHVPDPSGETQSVRYQVENAAAFRGGEGIVYFEGTVSFCTKLDNRVWVYDVGTSSLALVYDHATAENPILSGVDNITLSQDGELVIAEDGGDLQIVAITASNRLVPLIQLVGHDSSEITGPSFSPDGQRLYFSSQRGTTGRSSEGITFEVSGPFHRTA